jgi:Ca2+-dependent lipid-binding protein
MEALRALRLLKDDAPGPSSAPPPCTSPNRRNPAAEKENSREHICSDDDNASNSNGNGRIEFNLKYDPVESTLTLKVIRAVDLPAKDFISGTSDPYVKIMLLPEKGSKMSTSIKRRNLNPRWNEIFAFEGFSVNKLMNRTLYMQVLDYDRFSRDDPIGEVCVPIGELDLSVSQTLWRNLQPCKGHSGKLGELLLSLCYQTNVGAITVEIIEARGLRAMDINGYSDPYVKIWLTFDGKKVEKKKTVIHQKTLNPVFNETFTFAVPYERIRHASLVVSVMDHDRIGRNDKIGQIILGTKSGPMEVKHWNEMFAKSRQAVPKWHILKEFD